MRLIKARIQNYRSIIDSGFFTVEAGKTILVGPNEAGKTAILQALQQLNPPKDVPKLDALRDYPRSKFNDITTGKVDPDRVTIIEGHFALEKDDLVDLPSGYESATYRYGRYLSNKAWHDVQGGPALPTIGSVKNDLLRLSGHVDSRLPVPTGDAKVEPIHEPALAKILAGKVDQALLSVELAGSLSAWIDKAFPLVEEGNSTEEGRVARLRAALAVPSDRDTVLEKLAQKLPTFVLFNNYFRVRPLIQLDHLAQRVNSKVLDDEQYDYGNLCLLRLLGFTAQQLSQLGGMPEPQLGDAAALKSYRDKLDTRQYQLNAASVRLTKEINKVWNPNPDRQEADRLKIIADRQYLKVVVEDSQGVDIELNQRSEGFQWLVSFFVVFFAEADSKHDNAILLLDEPGLNLHGLKQREFRLTLSKLAELNQTIFSTHSPFLVGPDELDLVRVVELTDREKGTFVHTTVTSSDAAGLLPLQEALGYDMAHSLFAQQRNLVLEGLTDYWYVESLAQALRDAGGTSIPENMALVPAGSASKVVYFATILHAHNLKVAALLDSDAAGDNAAKQDTLVHTLGQKAIVRTRDVFQGQVTSPEIEDLLRATLIRVAKDDLGWDVEAEATSSPDESIVKIFGRKVPDFSKYRLAKSFLRWMRAHGASDLSVDELGAWQALFDRVSKALS